MTVSGDFSWPPMGNFDDREWGTSGILVTKELVAMVSQERVDRSLADETATRDLGIEHLAVHFSCSLHTLNLTSHQHNREYFPENIGDVQEELKTFR